MTEELPKIEADIERERSEIQTLANKQEDPNWQLKEVVEMLSLEIKSLLDLDLKPDRKEEVVTLMKDVRKKISELKR